MAVTALLSSFLPFSFSFRKSPRKKNNYAFFQGRKKAFKRNLILSPSLGGYKITHPGLVKNFLAFPTLLNPWQDFKRMRNLILCSFITFIWLYQIKKFKGWLNWGWTCNNESRNPLKNSHFDVFHFEILVDEVLISRWMLLARLRTWTFAHLGSCISQVSAEVQAQSKARNWPTAVKFSFWFGVR